MIIINKNQGRKAEYTVNGHELVLGNEITINLSACERDYEVHIDICLDEKGSLVQCIAEKYAAQIDIRGRRYIYPKPDNNEEAEPSRVALPFDMEQVTLTLWSMEG